MIGLKMTKFQKKWGIIILCVWVLAWLLVAEICKANEPQGNRNRRVDTALWLARSIVGECGWKCVDTGEAAAIAWIYHKRSYHFPGRNYFRAMMDYSAAIRVGRAWIRNLNRRGDRPRLLEGQIYWGKHRKLWMKTLDFADRFFRGQVTDPCPQCLHFGGHFDKKNMNMSVWKVADTPGTKNLFFEKRL